MKASVRLAVALMMLGLSSTPALADGGQADGQGSGKDLLTVGRDLATGITLTSPLPPQGASASSLGGYEVPRVEPVTRSSSPVPIKVDVRALEDRAMWKVGTTVSKSIVVPSMPLPARAVLGPGMQVYDLISAGRTAQGVHAGRQSYRDLMSKAPSPVIGVDVLRSVPDLESIPDPGYRQVMQPTTIRQTGDVRTITRQWSDLGTVKTLNETVRSTGAPFEQGVGINPHQFTVQKSYTETYRSVVGGRLP